MESIKRLLLVALTLLVIQCGGGGGSGGTGAIPPIPPIPPPPDPPPPPELMVCLEWEYDASVVISGFKVYYGKVSDQYDHNIIVGPGERSVCMVDGDYFTEGMSYFFTATAFNEEQESDYSNEVQWSP